MHSPLATRFAAFALALTLAGCGGNGAASRTVSTGSTSTGGGATHTDLAFTVIDEGHTSRFPHAVDTDLLLEDIGAWSAFWVQHDPNSAAPAVDFTDHAALASLMAGKPSGGFSRTIVRVARENATADLSAVIRDTAPAVWGGAGASVSAPYSIASVETGGTTSGNVTTLRQEELYFEELFSGRENASALVSPSYPGEVRVARSQAEYDALWRYIAPNRRPPAQPGSLDFQTQQVVAVMTPQRMLDFGGLAVHRVLLDQSGELRVYADVVPYAGATPQTGPHGPWTMVRTNKTSGAPRAEQYGIVTGTSLAQGHSTFHGPRMMSVARDDQAYRQWEGALGLPLPIVDFDTQQVVIVFAGNSPFGTTFNSISVTELRLLED
ncbi:MAG: hypothetical protein ACYS22_02915, partial [Planctomycetota bacterium]